MSYYDKSKVYFSEEDDRHEYGVGFLVINTRLVQSWVADPVSSKLNSICLRAAPFNVTSIQVYAPKSRYDENVFDNVYQQIQNNH